MLENNLNIQWEEAVTKVEKRGENHFVVTSEKGEYEAANVLFAFGAMQYPRHLGVKGEDLPKVHHLFTETYPYVKKHALVVGGGNSAGEAALFLAQEGANATLATFRKDWEETDPKQGCIKHWVKEPLRSSNLELQLFRMFSFLNPSLSKSAKKMFVLEERKRRNYHACRTTSVFILIGSDADLSMLKNLGVETQKFARYGEVPIYDENTFETNVKGVYVVGHFTASAAHIFGAIEIRRK